MVSKAHANFFVNVGNASASDFFRLINLARTRVLKDHGIELSLEVEVWKG
jgi:UDP-N-acetylenolpyruvoylglucosamine reductase